MITKNRKTLSHNNTKANAKKYAKADLTNTYFLGFRDLPTLLEKYSLGNKAIDYGCGPGRSTRFLQANGFQVIGVDISQKMIDEAVNIDPFSHYLHIKNAKIPVFDESCDLILSSFVLFTISSKKKLLQIFNEANRCLRHDGIFIIITGSEELYSHEWLSYETNFVENKNLKSGDPAKIQLKDLEIEFTNYFWTNNDYAELFELSGFKLLETHFPIGKSSDGMKWVSEMQYAPYVIYILQKTTNNIND